jgi:2-succinyl-5-enolpyruvyl-6-hydroxy-3-cyclohexene-1-carboxylate synthase
MSADTQATFCATLVDEWIRLGVRHAMVAPGSRSTPLALALTARHEMAVEIFHDERSAAFAALGAGLVNRTPAIVLCTSGTAATHFHAAVVEAHQSAVPMLVVTADRPPELHGVGAPQTIEQANLYGVAVRAFFEPGVADADKAPQWRPLAAAAFARSGGATPGPVHLNLAFREPLVGEPGALPPPALLPSIDEGWPAVDIAAIATVLQRSNGVIVAGDGIDDPQAVAQLATQLGWPILADPRSNCRHHPGAVSTADALLRHEPFAQSHPAGCVLQLGAPPASKVVGQWLAATGTAHIAVSPAGLISDPQLVGARQVHAPIGALCDALVALVTATGDGTNRESWVAADQLAQRVFGEQLDEGPLSDPATARAIVAAAPEATAIVVSSSMPIRDIEWFAGPRGAVEVYSNRGANGIDGVVATAIGVALASARPVVLLIGDIALLHDSSSLTALRARSVDLTIVVTDNDGGAIFSFLPQATALSTDRFEQLFGTPHGTDLVALAIAHGIPASTVRSVPELRAAVERPGTKLVRVATDRAHNVAVHRELHEAVAQALGDDPVGA